jgi:hypothetical protein
MEEVVTRLDEIYWKAAGVRFVFGADMVEERLAVALSDFMEYSDSMDLLRISR